MNESAAAAKPCSRVAGIAAAIALAAIAIISARVLGHTLIPGGQSSLSPVLCAIVIGVLWRNAFGVDSRWLPGLQWVTHTLLRVGIALVGLRLSLSGIGSSVVLALPVVIGCITSAILASLLIGRWLGISEPLRLLLAAGTAICGCTAVVALSPVTRAQASETGIALTCVVVVGCAGMIGYPWLANAVFSSRPDAAAVFLATSIHDTSQVLAAALIYTQQFGASEVAPIAAFTKLLRNLSLLVLLPLFVALGDRAQRRTASSADAMAVRAKVLPAFLVWFVALGIARMLGDSLLAEAYLPTWTSVLSAGFSLSEAFLVCGMTAVGLSVSLRDLRGIGRPALLTAVATAAVVGTCSLLMTFLMQRIV